MGALPKNLHHKPTENTVVSHDGTLAMDLRQDLLINYPWHRGPWTSQFYRTTACAFPPDRNSHLATVERDYLGGGLNNFRVRYWDIRPSALSAPPPAPRRER